MAVRRSRRPRRCPACGSTEIVRITYGLPDITLMEAAERGEVALGGCVISFDDPGWSCRACERRLWSDGRYTEDGPDGWIEVVALVRKQTKQIQTRLDARIGPAGDLVLAGKDVGPGAEASWGDTGHEYSVTVRADYLHRLVEELLGEMFIDTAAVERWLDETGFEFVLQEWGGWPDVMWAATVFSLRANEPRVIVPTELIARLVLLLLRDAFREGRFLSHGAFQEWIEGRGIPTELASPVDP